MKHFDTTTGYGTVEKNGSLQPAGGCRSGTIPYLYEVLDPDPHLDFGPVLESGLRIQMDPHSFGKPDPNPH